VPVAVQAPIVGEKGEKEGKTDPDTFSLFFSLFLFFSPMLASVIKTNLTRRQIAIGVQTYPIKKLTNAWGKPFE
jgi:hypothetical protein